MDLDKVGGLDVRRDAHKASGLPGEVCWTQWSALSRLVQPVGSK